MIGRWTLFGGICVGLAALAATTARFARNRRHTPRGVRRNETDGEAMRLKHDENAIVIAGHRRREVERRLHNIDDLRRQYFELHNNTLEDTEVERALRAAKDEADDNGWDTIFRPKLGEALAQRRVMTEDGGVQNRTGAGFGPRASARRRRRLQTVRQDQGFMISASSPGLAANGGAVDGPVWCVAIRKITNNGKKVRLGILTLEDCASTPEAEIAMEYRADFSLMWNAATTTGGKGNNIFTKEHCVGVGRAAPSARLRTEICEPNNPLQVWGVLSGDPTWRPDAGPELCATARPGRKRGQKGGGKIVLKNCGAPDKFTVNQEWLYCFRGAQCTIGSTGFLVCDYDAECI